MVACIEHIDAISRLKSRDVLFVTFDGLPGPKGRARSKAGQRGGNDNPFRAQITQWLDHEGIGWHPCADIANEDRLTEYQGQIYIDIPHDEKLAEYHRLKAYLERHDDKSRFPGVHFKCCPLELALRNSHHDEPGFWDRWAEKF
jgi:hypothetical protein